MDRVNQTLRRISTTWVWAALSLPALVVVAQLFLGQLGADPVKALERSFGEWGLRILILTLVFSPLMRLGLRAVKFRRAFGVMGFAYVLLHFLTWVILDMGLLAEQIVTDLFKRPFILVGFVGFLLLFPLAITSTDRWIRRLGPQWRRLHWLAYPAILLGGVHFVMIGKIWTPDSLLHLAVILLLLASRLSFFAKGRARNAAPQK